MKRIILAILLFFAACIVFVLPRLGGFPGKIASVAFILCIVLVVMVYRWCKAHQNIHTALYRKWVCHRILWRRIIGKLLCRLHVLFLLALVDLFCFVCYTGMIVAGIAGWVKMPTNVMLALLAELIIWGAGSVCLFCALFRLDLLRVILHYKRTEYARQTQYKLRQVASDKGLWGEFIAYAAFTTIPGHKRCFCNAIIPKEDFPNDFAEVDLVCVSEYGIFVVESKNRGGDLCGDASDALWKQKIGSVVNDMENPIIQNEAHINTICRQLLPSSVPWAVLMHNTIFFPTTYTGLQITNFAQKYSYVFLYAYGVGPKVMEELGIQACYTPERVDAMAECFSETIYSASEREELLRRRAWAREQEADSKYHQDF